MNFDQILGRKETEQIQEKKVMVDPLKSMKPWVFKPKKVIYRLSNSAPQSKEFSKYHWTAEENSLYIAFLLKFRQIIQGQKKKKRKWHLNRIMSKFINTRSHEQCRSHHQKMIKSYKTIDGIFEHFQNNSDSSSVEWPKESQTKMDIQQNSIQNMPNCFQYSEEDSKQKILEGQQLGMFQYLNKPLIIEHEREWEDMLDSFDF